MGEYWWTYLCCGSVLIAPFVAFVVGVQVGKRGLPFRVRLEKVEDFSVED